MNVVNAFVYMHALNRSCCCRKPHLVVIPAKAGIHF